MRQFQLRFFVLTIIIRLASIAWARPVDEREDGDGDQEIPVENCKLGGPGTATDVKIMIPTAIVKEDKTVQISIGQTNQVSARFTPKETCRKGLAYMYLMEKDGTVIPLGKAVVDNLDIHKAQTVQIEMDTKIVKEGATGELVLRVVCANHVVLCRVAKTEFTK